MEFSVAFGEHVLELDIPDGVWKPTPHGMHLGNMLRKLRFTGAHVLEIGTGCGIHAILIAMGEASALTLTDTDEMILEVAIHNLKKHHIDIPIKTSVADWTHVEGTFDAVVTNPPFGKADKTYRRYFIDTLILDAHKLLNLGGRLIFVQSSMANIPKTLAQMKENGMSVRIIGEASGPFRDYYFEDERFLLEMAEIPGAYTMIEGVYYERLIVLEGTLER